MDAGKALDRHLRRHRLGFVDSCIRFDWASLTERGLHLIPAYEVRSAAVYEAVRQAGRPVGFFRDGDEVGPAPDPAQPDFFAEVESAVCSIAADDGRFVYVSFYSEEAYLAVTAESARELFAAAPGEILGQSLLCALAEGSLRMRRHRHGIRLFEAAARHHHELQRRLGLPTPEFPPWS